MFVYKGPIGLFQETERVHRKLKAIRGNLLITLVDTFDDNEEYQYLITGTSSSNIAGYIDRFDGFVFQHFESEKEFMHINFSEFPHPQYEEIYAKLLGVPYDPKDRS